MVTQLQTNCRESDRLFPTIQGQVQVVTSSHRSFFTNVMAQAMAIASQGTPVLAVQFLKGGINQGHERSMRLVQHLDWIRCDLPRCIDNPHLNEAETQSLARLWQHTQQVVQEGKYALVILDELSLAINLGLIPEDQVLALIAKRPHQVDIILTGPNMPNSILEIADQVTEIRRNRYSDR
jgi:cob(I)alamin adenosyltransferase